MVPSRSLVHGVKGRGVRGTCGACGCSRGEITSNDFIHVGGVSLKCHLPREFLSRLGVGRVGMGIGIAGPFLVCSSEGLGKRSPRFCESKKISLPAPGRCAVALGIRFWLNGGRGSGLFGCCGLVTSDISKLSKGGSKLCF